MGKLTKAQRETLAALEKVAERGAYPGLSLGTLGALERRGLAKAKAGIGSMAMPHTAIRWSITPAGRAAIRSRTAQ